LTHAIEIALAITIAVEKTALKNMIDQFWLGLHIRKTGSKQKYKE
jgi:hypothetical protein